MKCYCTECEHLELRPVFGEIGMFTRKYALTGTRFRCKKHDKYFQSGLQSPEMEFEYCLAGEKGKQYGYLDGIETMIEYAENRMCEQCPDTTQCKNCSGKEIINKIIKFKERINNGN